MIVNYEGPWRGDVYVLRNLRGRQLLLRRNEQELKRKYIKQVRKVLKSKLNARAVSDTLH